MNHVARGIAKTFNQNRLIKPPLTVNVIGCPVAYGQPIQGVVRVLRLVSF